MKKYILCFVAISSFVKGQVPQILKDINVGTGVSMSSSDMNLGYAYNNGLFFNANDGTGMALWYSLGLTTTTKKIVPTTTGTQISGVNGYVLFKGRVIFKGGAASGNIWITDGTNSGTYLISSIPGLNINTTFTVNANKIYFVGTTAAGGKELYSTDTVIGSTAIVKDIWPGVGNGNPGKFVDDLSGGFYFSANDGATGDELWHTNGTTAGTNLVKDIFTGTGGSSSTPMAVTNTVLFFMANDGVNGSELWRSDGTPGGTFLLNQLTAGAGSTNLTAFITYNNKFIYLNNNSNVYQADGVALNNTSVTIPAVYSLQHFNSSGFFYEFNGDLFTFGIRENCTGPCQIDSIILFKMTNTISTFKALQSFRYGLGGPNPSAWGQMRFQGSWLNKFIAQEYFTASGQANVCVISDGTALGSKQVFTSSGVFLEQQLTVPSIPFINNNWILSGVNNAGGLDCELHTINYNTLSENLVKNINLTGSFQNNNFTSWNQYETLNNKVYFLANDGNTGLEPWVSDGTAAGTNLLLDIYPGTTNGPDCFMEAGFSIKKSGNNLYFVADEGVNGKEPWVINNAPAGINENEFSNVSIKAYPNPFKNEVKINYALSNSNEEAVIKLLEPATGRMLMQQSVHQNKGTAQFNTENLSAGIYLISVEQKDIATVFIKVVNTK